MGRKYKDFELEEFDCGGFREFQIAGVERE